MAYKNESKKRTSADRICRENAVQLALRIEGGESALKRADELVATAVNRVGAGSLEGGNESRNGRPQLRRESKTEKQKMEAISRVNQLASVAVGRPQ